MQHSSLLAVPALGRGCPAPLRARTAWAVPLLLTALCSCASQGPSYDSGGTAPPPPPLSESPTPRPGYVWAPGYWSWEGGTHVWVEGHWMPARQGEHWVADQWEHENGRWHFEPGHWVLGAQGAVAALR